jgi:hypothetical protein
MQDSERRRHEELEAHPAALSDGLTARDAQPLPAATKPGDIPGCEV